MINHTPLVPNANSNMKRNRSVSTSTQAFVWRRQDWKEKHKLAPGVSLMVNRLNSKQLIVKKVVRTTDNAKGMLPFEVRALSLLPNCNRIVRPLTYLLMEPDNDHGTMIFPHYPLGDVAQWKARQFDARNNKPVPESYIWRCFVQMGQALAFLQNHIGPDQEERHCMLHRDIKPHNILVLDNGTTYPSFQLHDFGCALLYKTSKAAIPARYGTYRWQPPENPIINTRAAEIWALGACIHFLAVGRAPIQDLKEYRVRFEEEELVRPDSMEDYASTGRYCGSRIPREVTPINLSPEVQRERGIFPLNYQYSDDLADWMSLCLRHAPDERATVERLVGDMIIVAKDMLQSMGGLAALAHLQVSFDADI